MAATTKMLLGCPECRSVALRAWYLESVGYDVTLNVVGEDEEMDYLDTQPTMTHEGNFDGWSCRDCGAVGFDPVEIEAI